MTGIEKGLSINRTGKDPITFEDVQLPQEFNPDTQVLQLLLCNIDDQREVPLDTKSSMSVSDTFDSAYGDPEESGRMGVDDVRNAPAWLGMGQLKEAETKDTFNKIRDFFADTVRRLGPVKASALRLVIGAADAKLRTPISGVNSEARRAVLTAEVIKLAAQAAGIPNTSIRQFVFVDSPDVAGVHEGGENNEARKHFEAIVEKTNVDFSAPKKTHVPVWAALESDTASAKVVAGRVRQEMHHLRLLAQKEFPENVLITCYVGFRDTIAPFLAENVGQQESGSVAVAKGGGKVSGGVVMVTDKVTGQTQMTLRSGKDNKKFLFAMD